MRRSVRPKAVFALAAGLAILMTLTGAPAAPAGGGAVTGNVTITSPATGIPLTGACKKTSYSFSSVVLDGVISNAGKTFAGPIKTSGVKGGSACDVGSGPTTGTVNSAGAPASFSGTLGSNKVSGQFYGTFTRVSSHVIVKLTIKNVKVCNPACGALFSGKVTLDVSEFIPTQVTTTGIKKATFAGEFHVGNV